MIDIQFIRDFPDEVQKKSGQKGYKVDIAKLLRLDKDRRELISVVENIRAKRNENADQIKKAGKPTQEQIDQGKVIKVELAEKEEYLNKTEEEFQTLLKQIPNMPLPGVPVGASEEENVEVKKVGQPNKFGFEPKNHWQIAQEKGWIDKERAAKVSGARFAYIKGDLVKLQFAIIQFTLDVLTDEKILKKIIDDNSLNVSAKAFVPVLPPYMIRTEVYDAMDRLEPSEDRYKLENDDLWLQGSAEHVLGSMHMKEDIPHDDLPLRYLGYASSFRREAGSYGKDTEGIFRMHQFDKLEMESITDEKAGLDEHKLLVAIQEYLMQQLKIPYRVLEKCTADIGKPNAKGVDIDAWLPGQDQYRETHTADYMTDYQSRRLNMLYRKWISAPEQDSLARPEGAFSSGSKVFLVHTNDATAFALGRTMIAIVENYQDNNGDVIIPKVLQKYMGGKEKI